MQVPCHASVFRRCHVGPDWEVAVEEGGTPPQPSLTEGPLRGLSHALHSSGEGWGKASKGLPLLPIRYTLARISAGQGGGV